MQENVPRPPVGLLYVRDYRFLLLLIRRQALFIGFSNA
jgi:hypothetical protein